MASCQGGEAKEGHTHQGTGMGDVLRANLNPPKIIQTAVKVDDDECYIGSVTQNDIYIYILYNICIYIYTYMCIYIYVCV